MAAGSRRTGNVILVWQLPEEGIIIFLGKHTVYHDLTTGEFGFSLRATSLATTSSTGDGRSADLTALPVYAPLHTRLCTCAPDSSPFLGRPETVFRSIPKSSSPRRGLLWYRQVRQTDVPLLFFPRNQVSLFGDESLVACCMMSHFVRRPQRVGADFCNKLKREAGTQR